MKAGWKTVKLEEVCAVEFGERVVRKNDAGTIYPVYGGGGATFNIDRHNRESCVVVSRFGMSERCVRFVEGKFFLNDSGLTVTSTSPEASQGYIDLLLHAKAPEIYALGGGTAQKNLDTKSFRSLEIPLPPLAEQKRIVALLDEAFAGIDEAIAIAKKKLSDAKSITDSHIHSIFTKPGPDWAKNVLCELCTFSSGNTPSKSNSGYWNGIIPWISGRDMKSTRLSDSHLHISKSAVEEYGTRVAEPGTLLVLVRGMGLAHGAQVAELTAPCAFNQDIRGIHPNTGILPRYLLFALKHGINNGDSVLSSAAHGTLKIDSNELHSLPISFPNLKQQERIVASIDTLTVESQNIAKNFVKQVEALDELRKALLTQAFAGELTA